MPCFVGEGKQALSYLADGSRAAGCLSCPFQQRSDPSAIFLRSRPFSVSEPLETEVSRHDPHPAWLCLSHDALRFLLWAYVFLRCQWSKVGAMVKRDAHVAMGEGGVSAPLVGTACLHSQSSEAWMSSDTGTDVNFAQRKMVERVRQQQGLRSSLGCKLPDRSAGRR